MIPVKLKRFSLVLIDIIVYEFEVLTPTVGTEQERAIL